MPGFLPEAIDRGARSHGPDVSACDREPIHRPGSIQPHGLVLVADAFTFKVIAGAGDIETLLAPDWLGADLNDLLGQPVAAHLAAKPNASTVVLTRVIGLETPFDTIAHRVANTIVVELEPTPVAMPSPIDVLVAMEEAATTFEQAFGLR